jgi:CRP-like cAMP-binding protein
MVLSQKESEECADLLKKSVLLKYCSTEELRILSKQMTKRTHKKGEVLMEEGKPQQNMFVIAGGSAVREKVFPDGTVHVVDTQLGGHTVGSLHVMNKDPAFATTRCTSDVTTYELTADKLNEVFYANPKFAWNVAYSLTMEVRHHTRTLRTPLLEQRPKQTPIMAISIAAGVESFYRSALNALLNQRLTGVKMGSLFPNMHIQLPTRIVYINGFKGLRGYLDKMVSCVFTLLSWSGSTRHIPISNSC